MAAAKHVSDLFLSPQDPNVRTLISHRGVLSLSKPTKIGYTVVFCSTLCPASHRGFCTKIFRASRRHDRPVRKVPGSHNCQK
ncbi:hypothetical protein K438DRAFT_1207052 [Mycena galopus ATCC 62051]|nr:hypothetical protein K438DRAFT_1207052 [Mycena galopus ATCC 62051]